MIILSFLFLPNFDGVLKHYLCGLPYISQPPKRVSLYVKPRAEFFERALTLI